MGFSNPSRETKFSGANADREIFIFPVQLTTCRIGHLTRLIHTIAICVTIHTSTIPFTEGWNYCSIVSNTVSTCIRPTLGTFFVTKFSGANGDRGISLFPV